MSRWRLVGFGVLFLVISMAPSAQETPTAVPETPTATPEPESPVVTPTPESPTPIPESPTACSGNTDPDP